MDPVGNNRKKIYMFSVPPRKISKVKLNKTLGLCLKGTFCF